MGPRVGPPSAPKRSLCSVGGRAVHGRLRGRAAGQAGGLSGGRARRSGNWVGRRPMCLRRPFCCTYFCGQVWAERGPIPTRSGANSTDACKHRSTSAGQIVPFVGRIRPEINPRTARPHLARCRPMLPIWSVFRYDSALASLSCFASFLSSRFGDPSAAPLSFFPPPLRSRSGRFPGWQMRPLLVPSPGVPGVGGGAGVPRGPLPHACAGHSASLLRAQVRRALGGLRRSSATALTFTLSRAQRSCRRLADVHAFPLSMAPRATAASLA